MDEIQRLKGSRAAYRSHVTRTLKKLDVLEKDYDYDYDVIWVEA